MTDQQIDEFLEMLAKSPTSARDMVRGLFAAHEAKAAPAVPQGEPVHQFRKVHCADWYDGHPDHGDGGGPYEERTLYTATPAAPSQPVPFDQWNSSPYTQVLHETIKDLSQKLASMTQSQPVTLTDEYAGVIAWIGDKQCKLLVTEDAIKHEHTPGVVMRNTAHACVQEVIIAALRGKERK